MEYNALNNRIFSGRLSIFAFAVTAMLCIPTPGMSAQKVDLKKIIKTVQKAAIIPDSVSPSPLVDDTPINPNDSSINKRPQNSGNSQESDSKEKGPVTRKVRK